MQESPEPGVQLWQCFYAGCPPQAAVLDPVTEAFLILNQLVPPGVFYCRWDLSSLVTLSANSCFLTLQVLSCMFNPSLTWSF